VKLDMHCHTLEGSPDGHVAIKDYIERLKAQGFDGMLVTDHDSYNGYRYFESNLKDEIKDFVVLKGIEYDTLDAGHIIVIMPTGFDFKLFEHRGLPVRILIHLVHEYGGILGPAHPCGEPFLSIFATGKFRIREQIIAKRFDFIEGYNCGEDEETNKRAQDIGKRFNKPLTGGSDSHKIDNVGLAFTILQEDVHNEDELIEYIKANKPTKVGGQKYYGTIKEHLGKWNKLLVYGFFPYNRMGALVHRRRRKFELNGIKQDIRRRKIEAEEGLEELRHKNAQIKEHLADLFEKKEVHAMKDFIQHGTVSTYDHCKSVVEVSDKISRRLKLKNIDRHAMLRAAMLHDFYLYDWHHHDNGSHRMHGYHHANFATDNASEIMNLDLKEQEIISTHMWPLNITKIPKSREAWIVCMADKYVSTKETLFKRRDKVENHPKHNHEKNRYFGL